MKLSESFVLVIVLAVAVLGMFFLFKGVGKASFAGDYGADFAVGRQYVVNSHSFLVQTAGDSAVIVFDYKKRIVARNVPEKIDGLTVYYAGVKDGLARFEFR